MGDRVAQIRREIEDTDSDWDREKLQERLAKLAGGVAVIKVGAATEPELKERKHRIEDAVQATKAAVEEGIVAGGGSALVHAGAVLADDLGRDRRPGDRRAHGAQVARRAAALDRAERGSGGWCRGGQGGGDARGQRLRRRTPTSTSTSWPPASSTRSRSRGPRSRTRRRSPSMLLTTEALVVEKPEPKAEAAGAAGHGHSHGHGH